jgi:methylated-DNA-[protein]-cysteine S-methyltransferase
MTDITGALRAYDPAVRPPALAGGDVGYVVEDLGIGRLLLAARPDGTLLASSFVPTDADADAVLDRLARQVSPGILRGGSATDDARRQLEEYLAGRRRTFEVRTDPVLATPFQRTVLDRLARDVGYGTTTSYGALAAAIGRPTASRAVGAALGANPLCIVLPCHRVVAASGALTGYAGGVAAKQRLLELETAA